MKKWIRIIAGVVAVIIIATLIFGLGRRVNHNYTTSVNAGSSSIEAGDYSGAVVNLNQALQVNPHQKKIQSLLKQTQNVIDGNYFYQQKQFAQAIPSYQKALNLGSNDKLNREANQALVNAQGLLHHYRVFVWNYDLALHLNQQAKFNDSNELLSQKILGNDVAGYQPFNMIVAQAHRLQTANQQKQRLSAPMLTIARVANNVPAPTAKLFSASSDSSSSKTNASQMLNSSSSISSFSFSSQSQSQTETSSVSK